MPFPVRSDRIEHQGATDNGTAISIIILDKSGRAFKDVDDWGPFMRQLKAHRVNGTAPQLSWEDIMTIDCLKRVRLGYIFDALNFLRMIPGMKACKVFQSDKLQRPLGPNQLSSGKEHTTKFLMLPTVDIDESTYSGNIQIVKFVMDHLKLLEDEATRDRLALQRKIPWAGDQTTAQRCATAQYFLNECFNPIDQFEPFIFIFALFRCEMALGAGTYEHSRGTVTGASTLARLCNLLQRTGLNTNMKKVRPDFHKCDEALLHDLEARMRECFFVESGCTNEEEMIAWVNAHTDAEVFDLATRVYANHASSAALKKLKQIDSTDRPRPSTILTNRDLLWYYSFRQANKHGDVDRIDDLLPELLIFFSGSGNSNYAKGIHGFLQLLTHECTPNLRSAILKHCLLVNMQGREDSFYPIDQRQEHNNAGIRNYAPTGPSSSWAQIQKVSPAIPYYLDNVKFVEEQILGQTHSHIHKDPKRESDVQALMRLHRAANIHIEAPNRSIDPSNTVKDCMAAGTRALKEKRLTEFAEKREMFFGAISDELEYNDNAPLPQTPLPTAPTSTSLPAVPDTSGTDPCSLGDHGGD
ncbi:hypothetical protein FS749_015262 [Ceratobasidium sp. UAMH 11750]|nr:hypothetical protein FS749_015262 [Ceratobasidium sp. UAMH 11750]